MFKDIEFGMAAAENEKSFKPHLLLEGFLDTYGYINEIRDGHKFLVLGPKGSGKSAIGSKLELLSKQENDLNVTTYFLQDFPYSSFSGIVTGSEAPEIKYTNTWEFLILTALINSVTSKGKYKCSGGANIGDLIKILRTLGLIPNEDLSMIVKKATKKEFRVGISNSWIGYSSESEKSTPNITNLLNYLKNVCYSLETNVKHLIIIDGLDDVLTKRDKQYQSLSTLILAVNRINNKFRENKVDAKIIVLCRTDLFERLSGPNKNKIRQDFSIILDWYQDVKDVGETNLVKLINLRSKNSLGREVDISKNLLPTSIRNRDPTIKTLLENTRHTPRDTIQLLNKVQQFTRSERATKNDVNNGLRVYSLEYLIPEIKDELDGLLSTEEINLTIELLTFMKKRRFTFEDLQRKKNSDARFEPLTLSSIISTLFEYNIIGNISSDRDYVSWKYRNQYAVFNPNDDIIIHAGLCKGLNIPL